MILAGGIRDDLRIVLSPVDEALSHGAEKENYCKRMRIAHLRKLAIGDSEKDDRIPNHSNLRRGFHSATWRLRSSFRVRYDKSLGAGETGCRHSSTMIRYLDASAPDPLYYVLK